MDMSLQKLVTGLQKKKLKKKPLYLYQGELQKQNLL